MQARGLSPEPGHIRSGEFREDVAYSVARELLERPDLPTALYAANGVMALGVMRALADLGLKCPDDISLASTDTIPGIGGLRLRLIRAPSTPSSRMTNEALRLLIDRIERRLDVPARHVVFQPSLILGDSCRPLARTRQRRLTDPATTAGRERSRGWTIGSARQPLDDPLQDGRSRDDVVRLRELLRIVAEASSRRHEDHPGRRHAGKVKRIVVGP
jgi:hypothetical protein